MKNALPMRDLGKTGLRVSLLGLGAAHVGNPHLDDATAGKLLNLALDLGITVLDTARSYAFSEERIGRHLAHRRKNYVLCTKVGYGIPGEENWTAGCITAGIERALQVMKTDVLDVVHLHSCPMETLSRGECTEALTRAVRAGKVRVAGYAGDNQALGYALDSHAFGAVMTSLSIYDQAVLARQLPHAALLQCGVLVKRPLGGSPWRFPKRPPEEDLAVYWDRHTAMNPNRLGLAWEEMALRFAAHQPGVSCVMVGTANEKHLRAAVKAMEYGPLPPAMDALMKQSFDKVGRAWPGVV